MIYDRPLFVFDLETTGTDPATDRIVQLGFRRIETGGSVTASHVGLVNPGVPIPAGATETHHITDEMVKDAPTFRQRSKALLEAMQGCDLGGYNILNFDVPLLWEEFHRAGIEWKFEEHRIIDALALWREMMPRKLINAVSFFCPDRMVESEDMHDAGVDVDHTAAVLAAQFERWPEMNVDDIFELTRRKIEINGEECEPVDIAGSLARRPDGVVVYTHKRVRGVPVLQDRKYGGWMLQNDFGANTKLHLRTALGLPKEGGATIGK